MYLQRMERAVERDKNHSSIIMWSTGNESGHGPSHVEMIRYLHSLKDNRLVHCEDASRKGDYSNADVISQMYWTPENIARLAEEHPEKPVMLCEYSHAMENAAFRYFGFGPGESYSDMHHGSTAGMYESSAAEEYVPYVRPQEHGNHFGTKMLEIGKMRFEGERAFEIHVSQYSSYALDRAEHTDELHADGLTHVRVDYKVTGLGSNSCGPEAAEQYRLEEKDILFGFSIERIRG